MPASYGTMGVGSRPGTAEIPDDPLQNLKPNALIYGARYDKVREAFGGKGWFVENPKRSRQFRGHA
jgi:2-hydroxyacyl-CoA lyase 1